jgi:tetratricopeptide (TPR) repeat protein
MRRLILAWLALAAVLLIPTIALAQTAGVDGQVLDKNGKPWAGVTVSMKGEDGRTLTTKTDADGKFRQIGLTPGLYTFTLTSAADGLNFTQQYRLVSGPPASLVLNFKDIMAEQANSEAVKQQQAAASQFKDVKAHVDAGVAALSDSAQLRTQLKTATPDQKPAIQEKLNADYQTAITELKEGEQGVADAKDAKNHAVILSNLGIAYSLSGSYDDSAAAYQKAVDLDPQPGYYSGLSTALANAAVAQTDPAAMATKLTAAGASCDKVAGTDAAGAARCWKNIGIILSNKGDFKDAVPTLEKVTQMDPKDAQAWYLLGGAYTGTIDTKQEGDKLTYIIPPGTADAYQKCIDLDPNGPYAAQAKQSLDALAAMSGGDSTVVGARPKPTKPTTKKK